MKNEWTQKTLFVPVVRLFSCPIHNVQRISIGKQESVVKRR